MSDDSLAIRQLEKISQAIRDLGGLPVDFRLARKLADVNREIAALCAPVTVPAAPVVQNSCNRHGDCAAATTKYKDEHNGQAPGFNFHCHDDECEDCFGC